MSDQIQKDVKKRMEKCVESLHAELLKIRTGRAHSSLLDHVMVSNYGTDTPLQHVATVTASDARTLTIQPWDKKMLPVIEKAILVADLGLNPSSSGDLIRVPLPALTEERRKELAKLVRGTGEHARVSVRNIRRDANTELKNLLKDKSITEDDVRSAENAIQKTTDQFVEQIDRSISEKEAELMSI